MRAVMIALVSLVAFAGIGAAAITLLPSADSDPLHPIRVDAPTIAPLAPAPSSPAPAATPSPPAPTPPAPTPRVQAGLRDVPEPPPPLVGNNGGGTYSGGDDDDADDGGGDDDDD